MTMRSFLHGLALMMGRLVVLLLLQNLIAAKLKPKPLARIGPLPLPISRSKKQIERAPEQLAWVRFLYQSLLVSKLPR